MTATAKGSFEITGRHVLIALLVFFGVMFAANGVFVYFALSTFNGEETTDAYRKGLAYNERIEAEARLDQTRWQGKLSVSPDTGLLALELRDAQGAPVTGLEVLAAVGRPATDRFDHRIPLAEKAPGSYGAPLRNPAPGAWLVAVSASRLGSDGEQVVFRLKERIWLKSAN